MPLFSRKQSEPVSQPLHPRDVGGDSWVLARGEMDGVPTILRFDDAMKAAAGHPEYPIQIGVAVPLLHPNPGGLPSPEEDRQLGALEGEIDRLVGDRAVMVAVITTGVVREFVLYTGAADWIAEFDQALQSAAGRHEVQVMAQSDPEWNVYSSLCC